MTSRASPRLKSKTLATVSPKKDINKSQNETTNKQT